MPSLFYSFLDLSFHCLAFKSEGLGMQLATLGDGLQDFSCSSALYWCLLFICLRLEDFSWLLGDLIYGGIPWLGMLRKHVLINILTPILVLLRWLLWIAIGADIAIELTEVYLQKMSITWHNLLFSSFWPICKLGSVGCWSAWKTSRCHDSFLYLYLYDLCCHYWDYWFRDW